MNTLQAIGGDFGGLEDEQELDFNTTGERAEEDSDDEYMDDLEHSDSDWEDDFEDDYADDGCEEFEDDDLPDAA